MPRVAVIDLGTNSTRLLIADVEGNSATQLERRTIVTRLGRGVDLTGRLASEAIEEVCDAVADYVALAGELGADRTLAFATSAVRDADNGRAFIAELRERFDLHADVIDGEREARLTFRGVTSGREPTEGTLVVDIGGGSTELAVGTGDDVGFHRSLQMGVVRHSERHLAEDPPSPTSLESLAGDVRSQLAHAVGPDARAAASHGIAVAGTPTSLAAIDLELDPYDPGRVHGHRLPMHAVQRMLSQLSAMPLAERVEVVGLSPRRAPMIVSGIVILAETMRAFGLDEIEVSEHDLLLGAALDAADGAG